jgi:hypothetical protein
LSIAAVGLAAFTLASCGDDDEAGSGGPASFVPAGAPIYIEATVDPTDEQRADAEALLERLGSLPIVGSPLDPEDLVDQAFEELSDQAGTEITFLEDVEPWLGQRAALGVGSVDQAEDDGVFAVETTDEDAAQATLDELVGEGAEESEYDGVEYAVDADGEMAAAVFDGFVVLSSPGYFETVVDAAKGDSLADEEGFGDAFSGLDEDALARLYVNLADVPDEAIADDPEDDPEEIAAARKVVPEFFERPLAATIDPATDGIVLDVAVGVEGVEAPEQSDLLGDAPADSLVAVGLDDPAALVTMLVDRIETAGEQLGEPGLNEGTIAAAFEAQFGLSLEDALAEFGDGVVYLRGVPYESLDAGIVLSLNEGDGDPTTSAPLQLLTQLGDALKAGGYEMGPPLNENGTGFTATYHNTQGGSALINAAIEDDRVTLAYTMPPAAASNPGEETLESNSAFTDAIAGLGDDFEPLAYADVASILDSVLSGSSVVDIITGDVSPDQAILDFLAGKLSYAVAGTRADDDRLITRVRIGVD